MPSRASSDEPSPKFARASRILVNHPSLTSSIALAPQASHGEKMRNITVSSEDEERARFRANLVGKRILSFILGECIG